MAQPGLMPFNCKADQSDLAISGADIVNPSVKLVPRDARCVRDACAQRCSLNLDTVDLTRTKLAHQARAAVVRGILPRDSNAFLGGRLQT